MNISLTKTVRKLKAKWSGKRFKGLRSYSTGKSPALVAYLPDKNQGWILHFLWQDLGVKLSQYPHLKHGITGRIEDLIPYCRDCDLYVFVMLPGCLGQLIGSGFPPERIIYYHAHVRLGRAMDKIDCLFAVLILNHFERELMSMRKVPAHRLHVFPAGYDETLFYPEWTVKSEIDVLFVGRYRKGVNGYYHKRKRYEFQVDLANQLVSVGLRVCILGSGWDVCEYSLDSRIQVLELPHLEYGTIYRKSRLVCSVASQEGGPVSFLEGMACGCLMLSTPTGFIADVDGEVNGCWTLPIRADAQYWQDRVQAILASDSDRHQSIMRERQSYLLQARFSSLSEQLVHLCWPEY